VSARGTAEDADRSPPEVVVVDPDHVETPVGIVDLERARSNAARVASYAGAHGLRWRPHIKTHKSLAVARVQLASGARGLTVATPREAEVMRTLTDDLLLAYPPVGEGTLARVVRLAGISDLKVALDDEAVLVPLAEAATAAGVEVGVLVELDVGLGRVGVAGPERAVSLASRAAELPGVSFRGIQFYPGHVRVTGAARADALREVSTELDRVLGALDREGLSPSIVSGGSTPSLWHSHEIGGLTEIRSGSCIFFDREGVDLGVAGPGDVAYSVPGRAVVDAGSKALSKEERGGASGGYGVLVEHPEVVVTALSEEHGVLDISESRWRPRIGERVRVIPNHVCVSVNLQDRLLARDGERSLWIEAEARGRRPWPR